MLLKFIHGKKVKIKERRPFQCVKGVRIWSFFGPYFPAFGLKTERYCVFLHIQSECGKIRTRKTPNTDTFDAVSTSLKANLKP